MLVSLSFMAATWLLKYQTIVDNFHDNGPSQGRKHLIDNASVDAVEDVDMNNAGRQA